MFSRFLGRATDLAGASQTCSMALMLCDLRAVVLAMLYAIKLIGVTDMLFWSFINTNWLHKKVISSIIWEIFNGLYDLLSIALTENCKSY